MPDLDFLPGWYTRLQSQKRWLMLQVVLTLLVVAGLGLRAYRMKLNERNSAAGLVALQGQLKQKNSELETMNQLEGWRRELRQQAEVLNRMGLHVQSSQMIARLDEALPRSVALLGINLEVEETPVALTAAQKAAMKDPNATVTERKLKVRLQGVAPTDVELATFMMELGKSSFFDRVGPTFVRDRREFGHTLREFEVAFTVPLSGSGN